MACERIVRKETNLWQLSIGEKHISLIEWNVPFRDDRMNYVTIGIGMLQFGHSIMFAGRCSIFWCPFTVVQVVVFMCNKNGPNEQHNDATRGTR